MNKKVKKLLYLFFSLVIVVSIVVFAMDYFNPKKGQQEEEEPVGIIHVKEEDEVPVQVESDIIRMAPDVDLAAERQKFNNPDIVGRLEIPDLINILVVKGSDNSFYLSHALDRKYDYRGSEFIDYRVNTNSKQINVYGHNSRDDSIKVAFLQLQSFLDYDFFMNNKYIILQHDGGKSIYKIKALKQVEERNNREHLKVDLTGAEFVKHFNDMTTGYGLIYSREVDFNEYSDIIVLQTCSHDWDNALYTIIGVKIN